MFRYVGSVEMAEVLKEQTAKEASSIKLIKNTRGYGWEIKVYEGTSSEDMDKIRLELERQNEFMNEGFNV